MNPILFIDVIIESPMGHMQPCLQIIFNVRQTNALITFFNRLTTEWTLGGNIALVRSLSLDVLQQKNVAQQTKFECGQQ